MRCRSLTSALTAACLLACACRGCGRAQKPDEAPARLQVAVSIVPQSYFVQRIAGDRVDVQVMVPAGSSPHGYEPTPRQIARLGQARLYFQAGVPFEGPFIQRIRAGFKDLQIVDTLEGIDLHAASGDHRHDEPDQPEGDHAGRDIDPHTWLDPLLVKRQAATIAQALERTDPANADFYRANLQAFQADLDALHEELEQALEPLRGRRFFVFHPAYGYFARRYGLQQVAVEVGGKEPTARQLAELIEQARAAGVKVIFVQPQFSVRSAEAVARAIGGVVAPMDPLALDYLDNLRRMAGDVRRALEARG